VSERGTTIGDPIADKIAWARAADGAHGARLRRDRRIAALLDRLGTAIAASHHALVESGIVELCGGCERDEGGSCCGAGIEDRYDAVTLLIELLLGADLPAARRDPRSCLFLGPCGCVLPAKDVICVNFVCQKITAAIPPPVLRAVREHEGVQLETLFALHELVASALREVGHG
jgi:hypothetical protein